jgi:hypothetical protein
MKISSTILDDSFEIWEDVQMSCLVMETGDDWHSYEIPMTKEQALRLASILTTWAETGELPEGDDVW